MKNFVFSLILVAMCSMHLHAQISVTTQQFLDSNNRGGFGFIQKSTMNNIQKGWKIMSEVEDNVLLMISLQNDTFYLGDVKGKDEHNKIRDGQGITVMVDSTKYDVYMGSYKRDARHGEGFLKKSDGDVVYAKWRWDNMIKKTMRPATEEEKEKLEEQTKRVYSIAEMATRLERMYPQNK